MQALVNAFPTKYKSGILCGGGLTAEKYLTTSWSNYTNLDSFSCDWITTSAEMERVFTPTIPNPGVRSIISVNSLTGPEDRYPNRRPHKQITPSFLQFVQVKL
ncbi:MAG: hypothetical protein IPO41_03635 [Acidobacteria bacterium]|nr:hypothetical protein [Acidobacteriota bacterium]